VTDHTHEPLGNDPDGTTDVASETNERVDGMSANDVSHPPQIDDRYTNGIWYETGTVYTFYKIRHQDERNQVALYDADDVPETSEPVETLTPTEWAELAPDLIQISTCAIKRPIRTLREIKEHNTLPRHMDDQM
jgi:hypothetical protein